MTSHFTCGDCGEAYEVDGNFARHTCVHRLGADAFRIKKLEARLVEAEANLKWEQHRAGRQSTHSEDCHLWGPRHYECLLLKHQNMAARLLRYEAVLIDAMDNALAFYPKPAVVDTPSATYANARYQAVLDAITIIRVALEDEL